MGGNAFLKIVDAKVGSICFFFEPLNFFKKSTEYVSERCIVRECDSLKVRESFSAKEL